MAEDIEKLTTDEALELYEFVAFCAPFVEVVRKSDSVRGTLRFDHSPRRYYEFEPSK